MKDFVDPNGVRLDERSHELIPTSIDRRCSEGRWNGSSKPAGFVMLPPTHWYG